MSSKDGDGLTAEKGSHGEPALLMYKLELVLRIAMNAREDPIIHPCLTACTSESIPASILR